MEEFANIHNITRFVNIDNEKMRRIDLWVNLK